MSDLKQFKNPKIFRRIEEGELTPIGSFQSPNDNFNLVGISLFFLLSGELFDNEKFEIQIYSTKTADNLLWSSEELTIPSSMKTKEKWMGWIKFTFNKKPVSNAYRYYIFLKQKNYAPLEGNEMFLGYDFHDPQYDNGEAKFYNHPLAFRVEGEVTYVV